MKPTTTPSIRNGQRMNQRVAPTSRITSTSRRRVKIESRIVLPISISEASTRSPMITVSTIFSALVTFSILAVDCCRLNGLEIAELIGWSCRRLPSPSLPFRSPADLRHRWP